MNAGAGPSEGPQVGPVTDGFAVTTFDDRRQVFRERGDWDTERDAQSGRHLESDDDDSLLLTRRDAPAEIRVEADLRQDDDEDDAYGLVAGARTDGPRRDRETNGTVQALIDPESGTVVLRSLTRGRTTAEVAAPLPPGHTASWHNLALEVRGGVATAELTEARLDDPLAYLTLTLPAGTRTDGRAGVLATEEGVDVDNLSVVDAADLVTERVPAPTPGTLLDGPSDEFTGAIEAGWTAVRDPQVTVVDGRLVWPVESADLSGPGGTAGLLLQDAPDGDWTVETKLTIDLGVDTVRNFQQGGLVAYVDDDLFARLSHVAIWNTRQTEFGKEMPFAGRLSYGGTIIGPPSETTWLRLTHRTDASGEHELQASTSTDGTTWILGGVWTLPAEADLRVGILSHGNQGGDPATSQFDYVRFYAD